MAHTGNGSQWNELQGNAVPNSGPPGIAAGFPDAPTRMGKLNRSPLEYNRVRCEIN